MFAQLFRVTTTGVAVALTSVAPSGAAHSSESTKSPLAEPVINEVIVTARKREERASDIPATVQVLDRTQLNELGVSALSDLQTTIPNFFYSAIRPFEVPVVMRGLGAPTGGVPGVGFYIDGAYQVDPAAFTLPFYDVERVEVLKGPQGTLYGRNSLAGAINYITRAPSDHLEADIYAEVGNGNTFKGSVSLAGPLFGTEILRGRITLGSQRQDGFRNFVDGSDADFDDYDGVNARLVLAPSERFSADLKLSYVDKSAGAYLYHQVKDLNDDDGVLRLTAPFQVGPFAGQHQGSEQQQRAATLRLTYSAGAFDIVTTSTYDKSESFVLVDIDNRELDLTHSANFYERDAFSQELRFNSSGDGPINWLAGAYYTEGTSPVGDPTGVFVAFPTLIAFQPVGEGEFDGYALFSDAEYELSDRWVLGAGIRYDSIDKTQVDPASRSLLSSTFSSTQPKISLKYRFAKDRQAYVTAAKGFREGGFNSGLVGTVFESYPKEELWSYEAGVKSTLADGRGNVELAAFYIDASQFNGSAFVNNPILNRPGITTVPVGAIESYGTELSASYLFTDAFSVSFSGGYNVAEPSELSPTIQPGQARLGEQLQNAPLWNLQLTPKLNIPLNDTMTLDLLATISRVGPTNFRGEVNRADAPLYEREPFTLVDLRASLDWRNYTVSAFVKNATDETYTTALLPLSLIAPFGSVTTGAIYNQPRYYGVSVRASF
ncbi:MAG TPA: TonB-dependent receptor [Steroidobacter sp.]|uniref:TonB-dependent receptor n=1 Tax=Steroidobacter sp. TaxID=1978227 RepID=UPI002EDA729B